MVRVEALFQERPDGVRLRFSQQQDVLCILISFLVFKSAIFRRQTECLLQLANLSLQIDKEREHNNDVQNLTLTRLRADITKAYDSHCNNNIIQHIMIAIYGNVFKIIFICFMARSIFSIILFLPHSLIGCHVLDGEHAGSE